MDEQSTIGTIRFDEQSSGEIYKAEGKYSWILPERSEWACYMFGNKPNINDGIKFIPKKGCEPNFFVRWMMKVCFDCTWVKEKNK
jgi:hypothetical protein